MSKEASGAEICVSTSHEWKKSEGRLSAGGIGGGVYIGRGMLLLTIFTTEEGADFNFDLICHTEVKLASVLHVPNSSSYRQWNWGVTLDVLMLRIIWTLLECIGE